MNQAIRRYERILDLLDRERTIAEGELAEVMVRLNEMTAKVQNLRTELASLGDIKTHGAGHNVLDELVCRENATARILAQLDILNDKIESYDRDIVEPVRQKVHAAHRKCRMVETLLDRRRAEYKKELQRQENVLLDESGITRWRLARLNEES